MQSDTLTRVLLALILLCLVALVVEGFGDEGFDPGWGRYQVTGMRAGAPVLIRTDTVTGQTWKLELRGGGNKWVAFQEPETEVAADGGPGASARESGAPPEPAASAERDVVEPPNAPPLPSEPPRASPEVLAALPEPGGAEEAPGETPGGSGAQPDVERLVEALSNEELTPDLRAWVARQLGSSESPESLEALMRGLADANPDVAGESKRALAGKNEDAVREAAEKAVESDDPEVRRAAREILDSLE